MQATLTRLQQRLSKEVRGRGWRPAAELRADVMTWMRTARAAGWTMRQISDALGISAKRLYVWEAKTKVNAQRERPKTNSTLQSVAWRPVDIVDATTPTLASLPAAEPKSLQVLLLRGASIEDVATLWARACC